MRVPRPCKASPVNYQHSLPTVQEPLGIPVFLTSGDKGPPVITAHWITSPAGRTAPQPSEMGKIEARATSSSFLRLFPFLPPQAYGSQLPGGAVGTG